MRHFDFSRPFKINSLFPKKIFLLNAQTGQILNWFERSKNTSIASAVLSDNELVLLEETYGIKRGWDLYKLTIWDLSTLRPKAETRYLGELVGFFRDQGSRSHMLKTQDRIYLMNAVSAAVLSSKTLAPELSITFDWQSRAIISRDFKKLYVEHVSKVVDHLSQKTTSYDAKSNEVLIFNQETRKSSLVEKQDIPKEAYHSPIVIGNFGSRNPQYWMFGSSFLSISNVSTGKRYFFYQFESGEAMLAECKYPSQECWNFQLTPGARRNLMMKNREGKIVPMNDATFAEYFAGGGNE